MTSAGPSLSPPLASRTPPNLLSSLCEQTRFFFASSRGALLSGPHSSGERLTPTEACSDDLANRLRTLRTETGARACVAGAIPFEANGDAALFLLRDPWRGSQRPQSSDGDGRPRTLLSALRAYGVSLEPSPAQYTGGVARLLDQIAQGKLEKAVLARSVSVSFDAPLSRVDFLRALARQNPQGFVFWLSLPAPHDDPRCLVGASPELLIRKQGRHVFSNPLAGSRPRARDPQEDARMARELDTSEKDLREHALVVEGLVESLRPWCRELRVPAPALICTPTMWHLSTSISGELRDERCSSLSLARALHPTPAVCGTPQRAAQKWLRELEGAPRGLFAGAVGYTDEDGDGEWAVTLRCAELGPRSLRAWAGAGIVAGSDPWAEFEETAAKLETILRVLGLCQPHPVRA